MKVISTKTLITRTLIYLFATLLLLALLDSALARGPGSGPGGPGGGGTDAVAAGEALFRNTCGASTPNVVATVKGCPDARSVDGSKFEGCC